MKHHPIIFAMGENIPTISLAFSKYYEHKNIGALTQYGQEKYSINLENEQYLSEFQTLFSDVLNNYDLIIFEIIKNKEILKARKERFLKKVDELLN